MPIQTGLSATVELLVADEDTAPAYRSGTVPVLATPRVVALCEQAAFEAVEPHLPDESTSVGMRVQLDHLAPTMTGSTVSAEATLDQVNGRRLVFNVSVTDSRGLVAAGKVTRVVVDIEPFLDKAR